MYLKNERGLTLIEVLSTVALLSLIIVYIFSFISSSYNIVFKEYSKNEEQLNLKTFSSIFMEDLKYAEEIKVNDISNKSTIVQFKNNKGVYFEFKFDSDEQAVYMKDYLNNSYKKLFNTENIEGKEMVEVLDGNIELNFKVESLKIILNLKIEPVVGVLQ